MGYYREKIDELRAVEHEGSYEYPVQVVLVGTAVTLGWLLVGHWQLMVWFGAVYGLMTIERYLHRRTPQPYSRATYYGYLILATSIGLAAGSLPVFLWTFEAPIYHFAALVYLVGAVLNTFVVRSHAWPSLLCYVVPNALAIIAIGGQFVMRQGWQPITIIAVVLSAWLSLYLVIMVRESVRHVLTARETTRELLQAQKAETLANFAGGVAHDFNNLLGVIYASLEQARSEEDDHQRRTLVDQALVAVERSAGLTKQLLTVGRQSTLQKESIDLKAFMQELEQFLLRIIPASVKVRVSREPALRLLDSEPALLQSMLLNLAMNARDAMPGGGTMDIRVDMANIEAPRPVSSGTMKPGLYAAFSVTD
ncbi:MAG: hypothetical protein AAGF46_06560, partial [Pseudomonadota bacterium]